MSDPATTQPAAPPRLSPKDLFLGLTEIPGGWRNVSRSNVMATALTYALAEFATTCPSSEQMKGAQNFVDIFLNLAEPKGQPRPPFPDKRLDSSVLTPPAPTEKKAEEKK